MLHAAQLIEAAFWANVPAAHWVHCAAPVVDEYVPAWQAVQLAAPRADE
jgi:hypothetical protein